MSSTTARSDLPPILIVGVMNRSGTNYLADLLAQHESCTMPEVVREDYLFFHADLLDEYARKTIRHWGKAVRADEVEYRATVLQGLGRALLATVGDLNPPDKRLLLKTPRAVNLEHALRLFPECRLLLLMRDGRDVVESASRTFQHAPPKEWMARWADGARQMRRFRAEHHEREGESWLYLRYEDLFLETEAQLRSVLEFVQIDPETYPWDHLEDLPVRGSSVARGGARKVTWKPVQRPEEFNPIGRWDSWGWWRKRQFKRLAGDELIAADYAADDRW